MTPNPPSAEPRSTMNGKPVLFQRAKTVLSLHSDFQPKLLCDGPVLNLGDACPYSCPFCYVGSINRKREFAPGGILKDTGLDHEDVVIRRENALQILKEQLTDRQGRPKFTDPADRRVVYSSSLTDVAGNMDLVRETIEACKLILELTHWHIRLLSKSNLLPKIAEALHLHPRYMERPQEGIRTTRQRLIFGVSTGTLDLAVARAMETGTPSITKRLQSLHWLQDNGFRTFGMICPSLPQLDYVRFADEVHQAIRADHCEHVWAEVINVRGASFTRTVDSLMAAGLSPVAAQLSFASATEPEWEAYNRATFEAHAPLYRPGQLRYLVYTKKHTRAHWLGQVPRGAVLCN